MHLSLWEILKSEMILISDIDAAIDRDCKIQADAVKSVKSRLCSKIFVVFGIVVQVSP